MNLIDKDILLQRINTQFWSEIENIINSAPSIDIVRCKECIERDDDWCMYWQNVINPDDFCSYGEREGE